MPECGGPEGPEGVYGCCTMHVSGNGRFGAQVEAAQIIAETDHPGLFDAAGRVRDEDAYVQAVAVELRQMGLCAKQGGPSDELGVKDSNNWNEQYDIVLGNMYPRRGGFVARCVPARF
jgi:hypothetical protein